MIIGNGLVARLFMNNDRENRIFFASGVSNSSEQNESQFQREENLLLEYLRKSGGKTFIYFSTCSIYDHSKIGSQYVLHKLKMEKLVREIAERYYIFRVSNVVGFGGNKNLLVHYLVDSIKNQRPVTVHTKARRNLIDGEDLKDICNMHLEFYQANEIYNIAYPQNYSILEIIETVCKVLNKKEIELIYKEEGDNYLIDIESSRDYFNKHEIQNRMVYLENLISKYF